MVTPEQIEALTADERAELARQLADLHLSGRPRLGPPPIFGRAVRVIVTIGAVVMVPWTIYLAVSLPRRVVTNHWRLAWVGFDLLIGLALACTAWFAWHRRQLVVVGLATSAVLLVCDAWFDVTLSKGPDRWTALVMALLVELPLAAMFGWAIVLLQRASAALVWTLSGRDGPVPPLWRFPVLALVATGRDPAAEPAGRATTANLIDTAIDPAIDPAIDAASLAGPDTARRDLD